MSTRSSAPAPTRPLALIGDQDSSVRELLTEILQELGWDAHTIELPLSPDEVVSLRPQLLLLEVGQAREDEALHYAAALRRAVQPNSMQLLLTSTNHRLLERLAQQQGWGDFQTLTKPFSYEDLRQQVRAGGAGRQREVGLERALGA